MAVYKEKNYLGQNDDSAFDKDHTLAESIRRASHRLLRASSRVRLARRHAPLALTNPIVLNSFLSKDTGNPERHEYELYLAVVTAAIKAGAKRDDFLVDKSAGKRAKKVRKKRRAKK
jgi:hypothetical protein